MTERRGWRTAEAAYRQRIDAGAELDRGVGRQHAHDGRGAADGEALDRLTHQLGVADRLEGVVDAGAGGERTDRLHRIILRAVDDVRGADALGHLELAVEHVHADDPLQAYMGSPSRNVSFGWKAAITAAVAELS